MMTDSADSNPFEAGSEYDSDITEINKDISDNPDNNINSLDALMKPQTGDMRVRYSKKTALSATILA